MIQSPVLDDTLIPEDIGLKYRLSGDGDAVFFEKNGYDYFGLHIPTSSLFTISPEPILFLALDMDPSQKDVNTEIFADSVQKALEEYKLTSLILTVDEGTKDATSALTPCLKEVAHLVSMQNHLVNHCNP